MDLSSLTPKQIGELMGTFDPSELSTQTHARLYSARQHTPPEKQRDIAKYEHRAFAREAVADNPLMAFSLSAAIPAYQMYKTVTDKSRSGFDASQILSGFTGVGEGLQAFFQK